MNSSKNLIVDPLLIIDGNQLVVSNLLSCIYSNLNGCGTTKSIPTSDNKCLTTVTALNKSITTPSTTITLPGNLTIPKTTIGTTISTLVTSPSSAVITYASSIVTTTSVSTVTIKTDTTCTTTTTTASKVQCKLCNLSMDNLDQLNSHIKHVHIIEKSKLKRCKRCNKRYKLKKQHLSKNCYRLKQYTYKCDWCTKTFCKIKNLTNHLKVHKLNKFKNYHVPYHEGDLSILCTTCLNNDKNNNAQLNQLKDHVIKNQQSVQKSVSKSLIDPIKQSNAEPLIIKIKEEIDDSIEPDNNSIQLQNYQYMLCKEELIIKDETEISNDSNNPPNNELNNIEKSIQFNEPNGVITSTTPSINLNAPQEQCLYCENVFNQLHHLITSHMKSYSNTKCDVWTNRLGVLRHLKIHLPIHNRTKPNRCAICIKRFDQLIHMIRKHGQIHKNEVFCCCDIWDKGFKIISNLKTHYLEKHFLKKQCEVHEQRYNILTHLKCHVKQVHAATDDATSNCKVCQHRFDQLAHLLKTHDTETKLPHKCEVWEKRYGILTHLKIHINQIHFGGKLIAHKCRICNKRLSNLTHLINSHTRSQ